jgi:hypothetical protein
MAHTIVKTHQLQLDSPSSMTTQQQQQQQASLDEQLCRRLGLLLDCFSIAAQLLFHCCSNSLDEQLDGRLGPRQQRLSMAPQLRLPAAAPCQQQRQLRLKQQVMAAAAAAVDSSG